MVARMLTLVPSSAVDHVADEQPSRLTKSDESSQVSRPPLGELQVLLCTANLSVIRNFRTAVS